MPHSRAVSELPPCGLYRTIKAIGEIPAGRLVYFHNHGDPGPGVYYPETWTGNRATFSPRGTTLPDHWDRAAMQALPAEGFYRVAKAFHCCPKQCVHFTPEMFVQLGYNGAGKALLFRPELVGTAIDIPERGTPIDDNVMTNLIALQVAEGEAKIKTDISMPRGIIMH
jgi:hypothetical protein